MTKLKLGPLPDDKPVKVTVELPAPLHRDLVAYAEVLARETGHPDPHSEDGGAISAGQVHDARLDDEAAEFDRTLRALAAFNQPRQRLSNRIDLCPPAGLSYAPSFP